MASESGMSQSAMAWTDLKNSLKVLRLYSKPSSLRPKETSSPVSIRKMPTPPIHLLHQLRSACEAAASLPVDSPDEDVPREVADQRSELECAKGEKHQAYILSASDRRCPSMGPVRRNSPVRIELNANATMVVETMAALYRTSSACRVPGVGKRLTSSPTSAWMIWTKMWKNGTASIIIEPFPPGKILPPRE